MSPLSITPAGPRPAQWDQLGLYGCFSWENEAAFLADALSIVQPKRILEVGFFGGASAYCWLHLSDAHLTSVDPMVNLYDPNEAHTGSLENVTKLQTAFPGRFTFHQMDSRLVRPHLAGQSFDLMFIDGDHLESGIRNDLNIAVEWNIPWVLVDDMVTDVLGVYLREFAHLFQIVRIYPRAAQFQGQPIPIALLRRRDLRVYERLEGTIT